MNALWKSYYFKPGSFGWQCNVCAKCWLVIGANANCSTFLLGSSPGFTRGIMFSVSLIYTNICVLHGQPNSKMKWRSDDEKKQYPDPPWAVLLDDLIFSEVEAPWFGPGGSAVLPLWPGPNQRSSPRPHTFVNFACQRVPCESMSRGGCMVHMDKYLQRYLRTE